jgi:hypothetical protein
MPARRALLSPMAIACWAERAPCLPSLTCSISSRTNSPAAVEGDFPCFKSSLARSMTSFSGITSLFPAQFGCRNTETRDGAEEGVVRTSFPRASDTEFRGRLVFNKMTRLALLGGSQVSKTRPGAPFGVSSRNKLKACFFDSVFGLYQGVEPRKLAVLGLRSPQAPHVINSGYDSVA